eukprot:scaffold4478_cov185-Skeletonema_marinoi.AAC.3
MVDPVAMKHKIITGEKDAVLYTDTVKTVAKVFVVTFFYNTSYWRSMERAVKSAPPLFALGDIFCCCKRNSDSQRSAMLPL